MNINKATGGIPLKFDYHYYDTDGTMQTSQIAVKVKRAMYQNIAAAQFRKALETIDENPVEAARLLVENLESWDIFLDDEETVKFPLTVENIAEREPAFVNALSEAVMQGMFPNPPIAEKSPDGSAQVGLTKAARNR